MIIPALPARLPGMSPLAAVAAILAALGLVFGAIALAAGLLELQGPDYLLGALIALGAAALLLLLFGPSWLVISVFLLKMLTGHQFRSLVTFELLGVEWHPREFFLFLLLAHGVIKLLLARARLEPDLLHYFFYLYCFFFAFIAAIGVFRQPDIGEIIKEARFPLFLLSYFVFVISGIDRRALGLYTWAIGAATIAIAAAATAFFAYTLLTGATINVQNAYGEFVPRWLGPLHIQTVRPNGHMFFEIGLVLLLSMILCPGIGWFRRLLYAALLALFAFAVLITNMRTAYIAVAFSLAMLAFLALPRRFQVITAFSGIAAAALVALAFGLEFYELLTGRMRDAGVSLQARFVEIAGAWEVFLEYPLLGAGMGSAFEGMGYVADTSQIAYGRATYQTLHNVWMYYLFKGGLVGVALVLLGLGGIFVRAIRVMEALENPRDRFFLRAMIASFAGQLLASLAMPRMTYPEGGVFLAMMTALFFVYARENAAAEKKDESLAPQRGLP